MKTFIVGLLLSLTIATAYAASPAVDWGPSGGGTGLSSIPYTYTVPINGATILAAVGEQRRLLNPAGTLTTLTLTLPPNPSDGATFEVMSTQTITTFTINSSDSSTVRGGSFRLNPDSGASWIYRSATTTWYVRY